MLLERGESSEIFSRQVTNDWPAESDVGKYQSKEAERDVVRAGSHLVQVDCHGHSTVNSFVNIYIQCRSV